ncbi:MAG: tetratricopeptide repeat protein [Pyrinomonadaceae bacterium]|nr:tetratricopeptide repeat protein [Pyrinomonadaceae bacterium]
MYLQTGCTLTAEGEPPTATVAKDSIPGTLQEADSLFSQRRDVEKLRAAFEAVKKLRDPADRNYEVEWKFAKFSYFLGKQTSDESEAQAIFERGKEAGKIASRIEPDKPDGHFWFAANLGELAKMSPVTVGIKSVDEIKDAMNTVVRIDPAYQAASAFDALAQVEMGTRLYGGSEAKAVELLENGLSINSSNGNLRVTLAEAYLAVKRDSDARKQIDELLKMQPVPGYEIEHEAAVAKAKQLLSTSF